MTRSKLQPLQTFIRLFVLMACFIRMGATKAILLEHESPLSTDKIGTYQAGEGESVDKLTQISTSYKGVQLHSTKESFYSNIDSVLHKTQKELRKATVYKTELREKNIETHYKPRILYVVKRGKRDLQVRKNATVPHSEPEMRAKAEPGPDWTVAFQHWKWAWELHVYLFGSLFFMLAFGSTTNLMKLLCARKNKKGLKFSLSFVLALFGTTRALVLFIDPYGSRGVVGNACRAILWSSGFPSVLASFTILLLVLLDTTKCSLGPPKFQKLSVVMTILVFNYLFVIATDLIGMYWSNGKVIILLCQIYNIMFGLFLSFGYLRVGCKISQNTSVNINRDPKIEKLRRLINCSAVASLALFGAQVYATASIFGVFSTVQFINPWPWYTMQSILRGLEILVCVLILLTLSNNAGDPYQLNRLIKFCSYCCPVKVASAPNPASSNVRSRSSF